MKMRLAVLGMVVCLCLTLTTAWAGGIDPASFAGSHLLSTIQGPSVEEAGRGGAGVAVDHPYGGNPAAVPVAKTATVMLMQNSFPNGLDVSLLSAKVTMPIGKQTGLMLNWDRQSSSSGRLSDTPYGLDLDATDLTFSVSQRFDRLKVGMALAPKMETGLHVTGGGSVLAGLSSDERYGARLGFLYDAGNGLSFGGSYDNYVESVGELSGPYSDKSDFRSEALRLGAAYSSGRLLLAADHFHAKISGKTGLSLNEWLIGADYRLSDQWTVRSGYWDGGWSAGAGFCGESWSANLAYVRDIWGDQFDNQMGGPGSNTWSLNVARCW